VVVIAFIVSGCTTVTRGSGEPPTGRWSTLEAQQHYLDDVAPGNQDIEIVNRLICTCVSELDPQQLANACAAVVNDHTSLVENLETGAWPTNAVSAINDLIGAVNAQAEGYQGCASAESVASMRSHEENAATTTAQATEVRRALGLPPPGPAVMAPKTVVSSPPGAY
jgi:hypothetical protein